MLNLLFRLHLTRRLKHNMPGFMMTYVADYAATDCMNSSCTVVLVRACCSLAVLLYNEFAWLYGCLFDPTPAADLRCCGCAGPCKLKGSGS